MKKISSLKLFLVYKDSAHVVESSLNNFKPSSNSGPSMHQQTMRKVLREVGMNCRNETVYRFPSDRKMYIGFSSVGSALQHIEANKISQERKIQEDRLATSRFIEQYKKDMGHDKQSS